MAAGGADDLAGQVCSAAHAWATPAGRRRGADGAHSCDGRGAAGGWPSVTVWSPQTPLLCVQPAGTPVRPPGRPAVRPPAQPAGQAPVRRLPLGRRHARLSLCPAGRPTARMPARLLGAGLLCPRAFRAAHRVSHKWPAAAGCRLQRPRDQRDTFPLRSPPPPILHPARCDTPVSAYLPAYLPLILLPPSSCSAGPLPRQWQIPSFLWGRPHPRARAMAAPPPPPPTDLPHLPHVLSRALTRFVLTTGPVPWVAYHGSGGFGRRGCHESWPRRVGCPPTPPPWPPPPPRPPPLPAADRGRVVAAYRASPGAWRTHRCPLRVSRGTPSRPFAPPRPRSRDSTRRSCFPCLFLLFPRARASPRPLGSVLFLSVLSAGFPRRGGVYNPHDGDSCRRPLRQGGEPGKGRCSPRHHRGEKGVVSPPAPPGWVAAHRTDRPLPPRRRRRWTREGDGQAPRPRYVPASSAAKGRTGRAPPPR